MGVWLGPTIGKMSARGYSFSGQKEYKESGENWEIALKTSGTFRFKAKVDAIDIFLVGGGQNGADGFYSGQTACGGKGGDGGAYKIVTNVSVTRATNYAVIIGENGGNSSFGTNSSSGGTVKKDNAGSTTTYPGGGSAAGSGASGIKAFNESGTLIGGNTIYGSSGGGGGSARTSDTAGQNPGTGGTGAGAGGTANGSTKAVTNGSQATTPGSGGGGGAAVYVYDWATQPDPSTGGAGAPGIIIIRNHRSS